MAHTGAHCTPTGVHRHWQIDQSAASGYKDPMMSRPLTLPNYTGKQFLHFKIGMAQHHMSAN